jgi:hypothetical protein
LILDNYSTHKHANVQQWLAKHPRQPAFDKPPTHTPTVCGQTPASAATCLLGLPAAQPNTIRHRCANACDDDGLRAHRSNVWRSSSVNTNSAFGLPLFAMDQAYNYLSNSWRRTLEPT